MEPLGQLPLPPDDPIYPEISLPTPPTQASSGSAFIVVPTAPSKRRIWGQLLIAAIIGAILGATGVRLLDRTIAAMPQDSAQVTAVRHARTPAPIVKGGKKSSPSSAVHTKTPAKKAKHKPWLSK